MLLNGVARAVERRRLMLENRRLLEALRARLEDPPAQREPRAGHAHAAGPHHAPAPWGGQGGEKVVRGVD